jgi:hypothetical protein
LVVLCAAAISMTLVGSTGSASTPTVPNVTGKKMAAAVERLVAAGYYADTAPVTNRAKRGIVTTQEPRPGRALKRGKPVRLAVSIGSRTRRTPPLVKIPNVVGKSARYARATLVRKKLTMATKLRKSGPAKRGKVIAQNPAFGVFRQYVTVTILVGK